MLIRFFRNKEDGIPFNSYKVHNGVGKMDNNTISGDAAIIKSFITKWLESYPNGKTDFILDPTTQTV